MWTTPKSIIQRCLIRLIANYWLNHQISLKDMLSATGECALKFHIAKFEVDKNNFTWNFEGKLSSIQEFVETFKALSLSSFPSPSTSQDNVSLFRLGNYRRSGDHIRWRMWWVIRTENSEEKKNGFQNECKEKEKTEHHSKYPEKCLKPNSIDEEMESHYLGILPFYIDSTSLWFALQ